MLNTQHRAAFFIEHASSCDDPAVVASAYRDLIEACGYQHFVMSGVPTTERDPRKLVAHDAWPQGWLDRFEEEMYFQDDPVRLFAASRTRPFAWSEARIAHERTSRSRKIEDEATGVGLRSGFVMPLCSMTNWQTVVSIASSERSDNLDEADQGQLYLASAFMWSALERLTDDDDPDSPILSKREAEVLQWVASGKTYWEVSRILSISEKTVEHHVGRIRRKLDAATTPHAVARGIALREIALS